jgi:ribosomal protein L28
MCVLIFYATFVGNISHSKNKSARYHHKCNLVFKKVQNNTGRFSETSILSAGIQKKSSNLKFREDLTSGTGLSNGDGWKDEERQIRLN